MADDRPALAEGLDRHQGARRHQDRGHLQGAPGAGDAGAHQPRAPEGARGLAALLRPRGAVRRERRADSRGARGLPDGRPAHGRQPARQRRQAAQVRCKLPELGHARVAVHAPAGTTDSALGALGSYLADVFRLNEEERNFRIVCPDEVASNRLGAVFEATDHAWEWPLDPEIDTGHAPDGRVMEVLSEHNCQGWLQGYVLTGRHGVFPCYEAFIPIVDGMVNQYGKFLKMSRDEAPWREPVASLNYLLTSVGWRQDHNGYSHQVPGFINTMLNRREETAAGVPAAGREHAAGDDGAVPGVHEADQPRDRLQAPAAAVAVDGRGGGARPRRGLGVGVGEQRRRRRARPGAGQLRHDPDDRAAGHRQPAAPGGAGAQGALRQRDQPVLAGAARAPSGRDVRPAVRRALHRRPAGAVQLPRLPLGRASADPPPAAARSASTSRATSRRGRPRPRSTCSR